MVSSSNPNMVLIMKLKYITVIASCILAFNSFADAPSDIRVKQILAEFQEEDNNVIEDGLKYIKVIPTPYGGEGNFALVGHHYMYVTIVTKHGPMEKITYDPNREYYLAVFPDGKVKKVTPRY
jgi:hypothetical protein